MPLPAVVLLIISFSLAVALVGLYRYYAHLRGLMDMPNQRSSHQQPTPRGAGIVFVLIWLGFTLSEMLLGHAASIHPLLYLPGALLITLLGFWDDHQHIPAKWRLLFQLIAATSMVLALGVFPPLEVGSHVVSLGILGSVLAVFAIVWSTNLYNFMDGLDGLAAVQALFLYGLGGAFLWFSGATWLALSSWVLASAVLGFLLWNWPKARVFMGDVGSTLLGFLVIPFALIGRKWYNLPATLWLILYAPFLMDATLTLFRRLLKGERVWEGHRKHAFQRLYHAGWSQQAILAGIISLDIVLALFAVFSLQHHVLRLPLCFVSYLGLAVLYLCVERVAPMYRKSLPGVSV